MLLKTWRFLTVILTALSAGLSFAHLLELPPRVFYFDAQLWIATTTRGLYALFGTVGAFVEMGSILTAVVLTLLVRGRGSVFRLSLAGAVLLVLAFVLWLSFVAPVNAELATWTPTAYPADWSRYRDQWEYTHATNAFIKIVALSSLVLSLIAGTRDEPRFELPASGLRGRAAESYPRAGEAELHLLNAAGPASNL